MQIQINRNQREMKRHGEYAFPLLVSRESITDYEFSTFSWHWHPEMELTLVEEGEMVYQINGTAYHLRKGNVLFGNSNALHSGHAIDRQICRYISITFDPRLLYGFEGSLFQKKYVEPLVDDYGCSSVCFDGSQPWHAGIRQKMKQLINLWDGAEDFYEFRMQIAREEIWLLLLEHQEAFAVEKPRILPRELKRLKKILGFIHENYSKKITLEEIAGAVPFCKSECCRFFKRYMRESLFEYLQRYRVEQSLSVLENPECSVTDAAYSCGFEDAGYYSKVFRKYMGRSPRDYKKESKKLDMEQTPAGMLKTDFVWKSKAQNASSDTM